MTLGKATGLVITVGFSKDPILFTIRTFKPTHIQFICSAESIDEVVRIQDVVTRELALNPNNVHRTIVEKSRPSDTLKAVHSAVTSLEGKGIPREEIAIDSTGGTKPMTAGALIASSYMGIRNIYVNAATDANGEPIPQTMKIENLPNPYDDIGFIEAKLGLIQINNHHYALATYIFEALKDKVIRLHMKVLYQALASLSRSLDAWDKFAHEEALRIMTESGKTLRSYQMDTKDDNALRTLRILDEKISILKLLADIQHGVLLRIIDLLANAERRLRQERYDDSAARSYRTIEAAEQYALAKYGIDTSKPDYAKLDKEILNQFLEKAGLSTSPREISCYHGYMLLNSLNDPLGKSFVDHEDKYLGIMKARNSSILAHGYRPIAKSSAQGIYDMAELFTKELVLKEGLDFNQALEQVRHPQLDDKLAPSI